jgi:hypothetical protein
MCVRVEYIVPGPTITQLWCGPLIGQPLLSNCVLGVVSFISNKILPKELHPTSFRLETSISCRSYCVACTIYSDILCLLGYWNSKLLDIRAQRHIPVVRENFQAKMFRKLEKCQTASNHLTFSVEYKEINCVDCWLSEKYGQEAKISLSRYFYRETRKL